ncbi:DUF3325 domain-containing protein [Achromobacter arsenitoxydans]|uniref:Membrane protein n=1 Tax=Achromobacter arsenitoxydans SY8 TaxID=477184 RepID=H0F6P8_9BURK|nr:DUF3325 domain-containing protein [Achromobacter arsenitoxydans]EHK66060.1 membrane protein [Achromobacter arsenitoxydans SY8]
MSTTFAALAALALAFAAFACLALAMDRHQAQATGRDTTTPGLRFGLRLSAALLALVGMAACLQAWGVAVAALVWLGMLSCGAILTTLTLSYAPRRLRILAAAAALLGLGLAYA